MAAAPKALRRSVWRQICRPRLDLRVNRLQATVKAVLLAAFACRCGGR